MNYEKKAFNFVQSLSSNFLDLMGYPRIQFYSDYVEVYFDCSKTIRSLDILNVDGYDEMRFFVGDGFITFVYTFYFKHD